MNVFCRLVIGLSLFALPGCKRDKKPAVDPTFNTGIEQKDSIQAVTPIENPEWKEEKTDITSPKRPGSSTPPPARSTAPATIGTKEFVDVLAVAPSIKLDIRYATANNFTKAQIYDCPACLLRPEVAQALGKAHQELRQKGFGLKMFDCYRPRPYQQRLWDKVPNPDYVTPPAKGSMHSRGAAVDLTVVDAQGKELDMGTEYDFFGPEAHTDYTRLSAKVLENRKLLRQTLEKHGFEGIRTEWWHFSFRGRNYALADYVWPCPTSR